MSYLRNPGPPVCPLPLWSKPPPLPRSLQVPTKEQVKSVTEELRVRSHLPPNVLKVLNAMPDDAHPMTQLSVGVLALQVGEESGGGRWLGGIRKRCEGMVGQGEVSGY